MFFKLKRLSEKNPEHLFRGAEAILLLKRRKLSATIFFLSMASMLIYKKLK